MLGLVVSADLATPPRRGCELPGGRRGVQVASQASAVESQHSFVQEALPRHRKESPS